MGKVLQPPLQSPLQPPLLPVVGASPIPGVGVPAQAMALFARRAAAGYPSSNVQKAIDANRIAALIATGLWDMLDVLHVYAGETAQADLLNWKQDLYNGTIVGSVSFTANVGFQGDGTTGYIDTGFNPATAPSPKFTQNSGAMGFWSQTSGQSDGVDMGNVNNLLRTRASTNQTNQRINSGTSGATANGATTDGSGLFVASRTGPLGADSALYRDTLLLTQTGAPAVSQAPGNGNIRVLGRFDGASATFSSKMCSLAFIGAGLTAQNEAALYAIFA